MEAKRSMEPVIEATSLKKTFGDLVAVDGLSFAVESGECFGILGPNGAGKTSTIRMIYGFSPMTAGDLNVFGMDIRRRYRAVKNRIGVCQQENNLDPDLTVVQNLEVYAGFFNVPRREARSRALELLSFMSLENRRDTRAMELSGGMMRRLVIARALINNPDLLILDEPTTGLDPQSRHQVWERLEELRSRGLSILLTTHYMDEAARLCDRLIIMDKGKLLVEGSPRDLVERFAGRHVIEVAEPTENLRAWVRERGLQSDDLGHRLIVFGNESDSEGLFREIAGRCPGDGCLLRMATLEDVFLKLTGRELRE
ncbi:MAG TPA: ABC transporter ATP-binding protein [Syntrophales bacterium]|jgi:lipooligosaccharide transport system ATP-binding protein|nr:ABC transporter ATP-binding protein [Syntrophales bacterium]